MITHLEFLHLRLSIFTHVFSFHTSYWNIKPANRSTVVREDKRVSFPVQTQAQFKIP